MTKVTVSKRIEVSPNTVTEQIIYTVTPGKTLKLTKIHIYFPVGTNGELKAQILRGAEIVVPEEGFVVGDDQIFSFDTNILYGSEEQVKALLQNTNTVEARETQIILEGEEE